MELAEALALEAGPELDAAIARRVMGWTDLQGSAGLYWEDGDRLPRKDTFKPSTDIADAWRVVESMKEDGWRIQFSGWDSHGDVSCEFFKLGCVGYYIEGPTAPLAICRAALKACWGSQ